MVRTRSIPFCAVALAAAAAGLHAQSTTESSLSGPLSPSAALATPATTYALSGIDRINYYNGSLSVQIPVAGISGRGAAGTVISIPISLQWSVADAYEPSTGFFSAAPRTSTLSFGWEHYKPGYVLESASSASPNSCIVTQGGSSYWAGLGPFLTWMVYHRPDGSQTVLVDAVFGGQPQSASVNQCYMLNTYQPANRGRVFQSYDGSGLVFVSNQDVYDTYLPGNYGASGTLYFKDGTKYGIPANSGGGVTSIEDRNGNQLNYSSPSIYTFTINDAAGRTETINFTENPPTNSQDTITYPGTGGTQRTVKVNYAQLQSVLDTGQSLQTYACLFPELNGSTVTPFNPWLISSVVLPDNTSYTFQYNSYGELTRLVLPTGGAYTYRYSQATSCTDTSGKSGVITVNQAAGHSIYRRVLERDELADGVNISARTVFTATPVASSIDPNHPSRSGTQVTVDFEDAASNVRRRENHYYYGDPSSLGALPTPDTNFPNWTDGIEFKVETGSTTVVNQTQQRVWGQRPCASPENCSSFPNGTQADGVRPHDPQMCQLTTQLDTTQPAGIVFGYDQYNNQTDIYEFDYGAAPAIGASCPAISNPPTYTRHTNFTYKTDTAYMAANLVSLPTSKTIYDGSNPPVVKAQESWAYDEGTLQNDPMQPGHDDTNYSTTNTVRGNVTTHQSTAATSPAEKFTYYTTGNLYKYSDFNTNTTTLSYTNTDALHVAPTQITNALSQSRTYVYDPGSLKLTSSTDENNVTTNYSYADLLDRVTNVTRASGTVLASGTNYAYISPTQIKVTKDRTTNSDPTPIRVDAKFDGLGRPSETDQYESATAYIATTTTYDALGRVHTTTNPSRSGDRLNYATTYSYDQLGRTTSVTTADNSVTSTSYAGNQTTVTDPAGVTRKMTTDGLGRLTGVTEDPGSSPHLNYSTTYAYDALDNLSTVTQSSQTRSFLYDSRSRLTLATNPENVVSYSYDDNGNLTQRVSGPVTAQVTATYSYDPLNRIYLASYAGLTPTTPAVTYCYDGKVFGGTDGACTAGSVANSVGRLTQVRNSVSTTSYTAYDALGRLTGSTQATSNGTYTFQYGYDLAGNLVSETYPSGRTLLNGYDAARRLCSVSGTTAAPPAPPYACTGSGTGTSVYASSIQYAPHGALQTLSRGDNSNLTHYAQPFTETWTYNSRLQPSAVTVGPGFGLNLYYCPNKAPSCTSNNGNVLTSTVGSVAYDQNLTYDGANRVTSIGEASNTQTYGYDFAGNRSGQNSAGGQFPLSSFLPGTLSGYDSQNRLTAGQYTDGRGNLNGIRNSLYAFTYDAENRLATAQLNTTETFGYDGNGQRVTKTAGGQTTAYIYDAFGKLAAEYGGTASAPCAPCYLTVDVLGSTRVVTDGRQGTVKERHDYLPFGDELFAGVGARTTGQGYLSAGTLEGVSILFTGQYRDTELASSALSSGLDYFRARHMAPGLGRFLSPDPANVGAILTNPQSWNAYSYAWNNPLMFVDPTGTETAVYQLGGSCFFYTYDWYTNDDNGLTVHNSTEQFGDCSGSGTETYANQAYNQSATYQLAAIIRNAITLGRLNQCQGLANYADAAQQVAGSSGLSSAMSLLTPNSAPGQSLLGVRAAGSGLGTPQSSSGFLPQYQNSTPDSPATANSPAWNGDQTHHFAAFFQLGFSHPVASALFPTPFLFEAAEAARDRTGINHGDVNLGAAAQQMGQDVRRGTLSGDQLGNAIRGQLCGR